jgi:hypothetical protein
VNVCVLLVACISVSEELPASIFSVVVYSSETLLLLCCLLRGLSSRANYNDRGTAAA